MPRHATLIFMVLPFTSWLALVAGCGAPSETRYPLSSSIIDAAMEPRPHDGRFLDHMGVTALSGLSPINHAGVIFHYPLHTGWLGEKPPLPANTAIGIANRQTYELMGVRTVEEAQVKLVSEKLAQVQEAASNAVSATLRLGDLRTRIKDRDAVLAELRVKASEAEAEAKQRRDAAATEAAKESPDKDKLATLNKLADEAAAQAKALREQAAATNEHAEGLENRINEQKAAEETLARLRKELEKTLDDNPNILIVSWKTEDKRRTEGSIKPIFGASVESSEAKEGFAVLGGFRVRHLYIGTDFKVLIAELDSTDRQLIREASLPTYMLQVQYIRYVSKLDVSRVVSAFLELEASKSDQIFANVDKVRLDFYRQAVASLANMGHIQGPRWAIRAIDLTDPRGIDALSDFAESLDQGGPLVQGIRWLVSRSMRNVQQPQAVSIIEQGVNSAEPLRWTTLQATITSLGSIGSRYFASILSDHIEPLPRLSRSLALGGARVDDREANIEHANTQILNVNALLETDKSFEVNERVRHAIEHLGDQMERASNAANRLRTDRMTCEAKNELGARIDGCLASLSIALQAIEAREVRDQRLPDGSTRTRASAYLRDPTIGLIGNEHAVLTPLWDAATKFRELADDMVPNLGGGEW